MCRADQSAFKTEKHFDLVGQGSVSFFFFVKPEMRYREIQLSRKRSGACLVELQVCKVM